MNQNDIEKIKKRFYNKFDKVENGCWLWNGYKHPSGYGEYKVLGQTRAHRVSFIIHYGPIFNSKMCVCHKCDTPLCVNPDHLFLGTQADNNRDCANKKRNVVPTNSHVDKTHCVNGHQFTPENTYVRKRNGHRECRICVRRRCKKYRVKLRGHFRG